MIIEAELNPGVRMYHTLMSDWLERICGVKPPDIEAVLGAVCWHCGEPAREEGPPLKGASLNINCLITNLPNSLIKASST